MLREALLLGKKVLEEADISNPILDSQLILGFVLEKDRLHLLLNPQEKITNEQFTHYEKLLALRCRHVPVAYITGQKEFYGLDFSVKPGVLIPRPETEFVVEQALEAIAPIKKPIVADLCCGSGAIAISIAVNHKGSNIYASDISEIAQEVTLNNAKAQNVQERIFFLRGDLWEPYIELGIGNFDVIVSNPPYIPTQELKTLPEDVKTEPQIALDGGIDGLEIYQRILSSAPQFLKPEGKIVFEIGWNQAKGVKSLLVESGFENIDVFQDYAGFDRVVSATLKSD